MGFHQFGLFKSNKYLFALIWSVDWKNSSAVIYPHLHEMLWVDWYPRGCIHPCNLTPVNSNFLLPSVGRDTSLSESLIMLNVNDITCRCWCSFPLCWVYLWEPDFSCGDAKSQFIHVWFHNLVSVFHTCTLKYYHYLGCVSQSKMQYWTHKLNFAICKRTFGCSNHHLHIITWADTMSNKVNRYTRR